MTANPDLVIRGGTLADGTGGDPYEADVAIKDGTIAEVGKVSAQGAEEIDAEGRWSRRASSTSTPTMTARRPGTQHSRPPRGTASPPR